MIPESELRSDGWLKFGRTWHKGNLAYDPETQNVYVEITFGDVTTLSELKKIQLATDLLAGN